jgi:hypothetical protein
MRLLRPAFYVGLVLPALGMAENLVPNGDFEAPELPGGAVVAWRSSIDDQTDPPGLMVCGTPGQEIQAGASAIRLHSSSVGSAGPEDARRNALRTVRAKPQQGTKPTITIEPGQTYRLSFWLKREGFETMGHSFMAEFLNYPSPGVEGSGVSLMKQRFTGPSDWEQVEATFTAPPAADIGEGCLIFRLYFPAGAEEGVSAVTIDSVELIKL